MKLGTENGTLISKYSVNFWDTDIRKRTVSQLDNKACSSVHGDHNKGK